MSFEAIAWAWHIDVENAGTKLVLLSLANHHNINTNECWPSISRIAKHCCCTKNTVRSALARLEKAGIISRTVRTTSAGDMDSVSYTFHFDQVGQFLSGGGLKNGRGGGSIFDDLINHSNKPLKEPPETAFEEFWELYPKKVDRGHALKAWKRIIKGGVSKDDVIEGLTTQLPIFASKEIDYIPYPATWLNGERWRDKIKTKDQGRRMMRP